MHFFSHLGAVHLVLQSKHPFVFLQKFLHSGGLHSVVHNGGGCRPHSILHLGFSHIGVQF